MNAATLADYCEIIASSIKAGNLDRAEKFVSSMESVALPSIAHRTRKMPLPDTVATITVGMRRLVCAARAEAMRAETPKRTSTEEEKCVT